MARRRGIVPQALASEPELFEDVLWLWDAFWILNRSRSIGMTVGPIPLSEVESFARLFNVRRVRYLVNAVDHLDRIYLEHATEQAKRQSKVKQPKAPPARRRRHGHR